MKKQEINHKQLLATHTEWMEAQKRMKAQHRQELDTLDKGYKKMIDEIYFPNRRKWDVGLKHTNHY